MPNPPGTFGHELERIDAQLAELEGKLPRLLRWRARRARRSLALWRHEMAERSMAEVARLMR